MFTPKEKKSSDNSSPTTPSPAHSESTHFKGSRFIQLEEATKNLFRSTVGKKDRTVSNALAAIQFGSIGVLVPQAHQGSDMSDSVEPGVKDVHLLPPVTPHQPVAPSSVELNSNKDLTLLALTTLQSTCISANLDSNPRAAAPLFLTAASSDRTNIFLRNVDVPSLQVPLPPPDSRVETTMQLAYCNRLLCTHSSAYSAVASITIGLDPSQQASINALFQNKEEQNKIRKLAIQVVEEFAADSLKSSEMIAEVVLLGPFLNQEYCRKLLNCFIVEFEATKLLDTDLLQGLVQLVECAKPDYLQPDDFVRILVVLRTRLQDTHQQTTKHPYYLTLALSRLLDVMVDGKVQDLSRIVDHGPLSALLNQLIESSDPNLKHQARYAHQSLLHVPNDETRRQFVLRHSGNITMGLLGVASVCKLDLSGFSDGVEKLHDATVSALEIGGKIVGGAQSMYNSGQGIAESIKGGILSGGRLLWYAALREAQEHIQNGRLSNFNRLVFEAPCSREAEFQWGVCQLVGQIAVDLRWEVVTRQHAADLLADLYLNDTIRNQNKELDQWILQIIRQVIAEPEAATSGHAQLLLQGLEKEGDIDKQDLYRVAMDCPANPYPLQIQTSAPLSSPLLIRVQAIPDVEYDLHKLRAQRLKERENILYIPPQAKLTLQSSDDTLFLLMEKAHEFLAGPGQVLLLLGDSGGGKSTFNLELEHTLWKDYKRGDAIPLYINLPVIDNPQQNMIAKQLQQLNFSDAQIQELKLYRQFIIICDGYDESQLKKNIYATNLFNQPRQWRAKMVISCRSQYLGSDYRARFQPTGDRYQQSMADLFQEAVIAPFSRSQIEQYVEQFVQKDSSHIFETTQPRWTVKDYMDKLNKIPKIIELVANPFLLTIALRAMPHITSAEQDLSKIRLTRVGLYDNFIEQWLHTDKLRLEGSNLSLEAQGTLDELLDADFIQVGINFQKDLAAAIFENQGGNPVVQYIHHYESQSWKATFFSPNTKSTMLRESSPLARSGNQYRFLHRSILEYLYSRVISEPMEHLQLSAHSRAGASESVESFVTHPLNQRSIVEEPSILQFLAERAEVDPLFKAVLLAAVEESKLDARVSQAAANAISILVSTGVRFNSADLRGIRIPGADIYGGQFDSADLEGADLSNVNLTKAWLRQANLSKALMSGVQFGELPYLEFDAFVTGCAFSSDGGLLAVSSDIPEISVYDTSLWTRIAGCCGRHPLALSPTTWGELARCDLGGDVELGDVFTDETRLVLKGNGHSVTCISYSPDGSLIATASKVSTTWVYSTLSGDVLFTLNGHAGFVNGVAFSPTGLHLVSCSEDKTIRTWDAQTGEPLLVLEGHVDPVLSVTYSIDGQLIASADADKGVALWNAHTGVFIRTFEGHVGDVHCVTFSPDGHQVASCGRDGTVRLWDWRSGDVINTLFGHKSVIRCVAYSPRGDCIVSGSLDNTMRLWGVSRTLLDLETVDIMDGWRFDDISPDGTQTVTSTKDGKVQLWETRTRERGLALIGNTVGISQMIFSPCGTRVSSVCKDDTVRVWCVRTGVVVLVLDCQADSHSRIVFSPSGHQIAGHSRTTVWLKDAQESGRELVLEGHTMLVWYVVFSPSGHQVASCSSDNTIRLWCTSTGEQQVVMHQQERPYQIIYSSCGKEIISTTWVDGILRCWDPQTGEKIDQLMSEESEFVGCAASPSPIKNLIATVQDNGVLRIWDRSLGQWSEVYRSWIGGYVTLRWIQSSEGMYLVASGYAQDSVWELKVDEGEGDGEGEGNGSYTLRQLWSIGMRELSLMDADLSGAVGLSSVNLELVRQRGAIADPQNKGDSSGNCALKE